MLNAELSEWLRRGRRAPRRSRRVISASSHHPLQRLRYLTLDEAPTSWVVLAGDNLFGLAYVKDIWTAEESDRYQRSQSQPTDDCPGSSSHLPLRLIPKPNRKLAASPAKGYISLGITCSGWLKLRTA